MLIIAIILFFAIPSVLALIAKFRKDWENKYSKAITFIASVMALSISLFLGQYIANVEERGYEKSRIVDIINYESKDIESFARDLVTIKMDLYEITIELNGFRDGINNRQLKALGFDIYSRVKEIEDRRYNWDNSSSPAILYNSYVDTMLSINNIGDLRKQNADHMLNYIGLYLELINNRKIMEIYSIEKDNKYIPENLSLVWESNDIDEKVKRYVESFPTYFSWKDLVGDYWFNNTLIRE